MTAMVTSGPASVPSTADTGRPAARRRHVYEADVVRVLTFAAVIGVHTVSNTNAGTSTSANALVMLLHFTREAFFVLTGFVLTHQYLGRRLAVRPFWRRRLITVGVPYVAWSVIYAGLQWWQGPRTASFTQWLGQLGGYLIAGTAWYHLYFLLVSLQIYLVYPLIAVLLRATARHHVALLGASAVVQILIVTMLNEYPQHGGVAGWYCTHAGVLLLTYQFYVLLGCVVAAHLDEVVDWVRRHTAVVLGFGLVTALAAEAVYLSAVHGGTRPATAAAVLQPVMVPWSVAMTGLLFVAGIVWSDLRGRGWAGGRLDRALAFASDRSFGIYLAHTAVLWALLWAGSGWLPAHLTGAALTVPVYVLTVVGAVAVVELLRRCPLSLALTGRAVLRPSPPGRPHRKEADHASERARTAPTHGQAAHDRAHDGDRQRPADPPVHRPLVELS